MNSTSRNVPAIIDTAAATAPVAPASSTAWESGAEKATPKTSPKIETVPSSMPNTMEPTEAAKEPRTWLGSVRAAPGVVESALIAVTPSPGQGGC